MRKKESFRSILCLDIGSRTQDAILHLPGQDEESLPRFVLPSPACSMRDRIRGCTESRRNIYIFGGNMGGGFKGAVLDHLKEDLRVAMHPEAALALTDTPEDLLKQGVELVEQSPPWYATLESGDYDPDFWRGLIQMCLLPDPQLILAAAQDHGFAPGRSSRACRMRLWEKNLARASGDAGGAPLTSFLYTAVPPELTRLTTIQRLTGGPVMDSAAAALLGLMSIPDLEERSQRQGITLINAGNSHVSAFLVFRNQVFGVYEHHTGQVDLETLLKQMESFRLGWLPDEEVRASGGHGTAFLPLPPEAEGFRATYATGPRSRMLKAHASLVAPNGDMMQSGTFGLLHAYHLLSEEWRKGEGERAGQE